MIFSSHGVEFPIVYAYSSTNLNTSWNQLIILISNNCDSGLFGHNLHRTNLLTIGDMVNDTCILQFHDLRSHYLF